MNRNMSFIQDCRQDGAGESSNLTKTLTYILKDSFCPCLSYMFHIVCWFVIKLILGDEAECTFLNQTTSCFESDCPLGNLITNAINLTFLILNNLFLMHKHLTKYQFKV